jgi:signal transduction histidine kinase
MMNKSVSRLEGFIRDITDYARNKRQTVHVEKVNLEEMLLQTMEELMHLSGADRVEKSVQVTGKEFYSDSTRVRIIVKNLLSNALRYADFSKSQSFVRVMAVVSAEKAVITFEDNGIGIEAIHQPRIFDMFYRASEASAGTGIGLFLVRETVKILQGKINLVSTPGVGSTFSLELPNHLLAQGAKKPALPERDIISLSNE